MNLNDLTEDPAFDGPPAPKRKSSGPGRERKQKARRTARRKQDASSTSGNSGIHRRGTKRRSN